MARNVKRPRESRLIGMLTVCQPVADSGSALQAWGNEENNCTLLWAQNPTGYTDALFFFPPSRSSFSCHPCIVPAPSHLRALWDPGRETRMSPELAQPGSAEERKHSHWGNQVEHGATCEKPISIPCIITARWIAEQSFFSFPDQLPEPVGLTSEL